MPLTRQQKDLNITDLQFYAMASNDAIDIKLEAFQARIEDKYFNFHKTPKAFIVDIAAMHLKGDAIQWYDWFEHIHGIPMWSLGIRPGFGRCSGTSSGVRLKICRRDREAHWEHTGRSLKEDCKTRRKNVEGCRIGES
ncbi:hypothetical protein BHM03_00041875 [Ensete ventricosum]|nr:hypothetical protein BHM03_00041875 [Ensete ventricosum]